MKKIVLGFNDFINEELSFINEQYDYDLTSDTDRVKTYYVQHGNYDIEIEFDRGISNGNENYWERTFTVNGTFKLDKKIDQNTRLIILSIVTYVTKIFIETVNPDIILIAHFNEKNGISSKKRMKIHRLYITKMFKKLNQDYAYKVYYAGIEYKSFIYKDDVVLDKFLEDRPTDYSYYLELTNESVSNNTQHEYKLNTDWEWVKTYTYNFDDVEISVTFINNNRDNKKNFWERMFRVNGDFRLDSDLETKKRLRIISVVTYITKIFLSKFSPNVLYIDHLNENGSLSSEKRMKLNGIYINKFLKEMDYKYDYSVYSWGTNYITVIYKNDEILNLFIQENYPLFYEKLELN